MMQPCLIKDRWPSLDLFNLFNLFRTREVTSIANFAVAVGPGAAAVTGTVYFSQVRRAQRKKRSPLGRNAFLIAAARSLFQVIARGSQTNMTVFVKLEATNQTAGLPAPAPELCNSINNP